VSGIRLDLSVDSRVWWSAFVYCSKSKRKDEIGRSERLEWNFVKGRNILFISPSKHVRNHEVLYAILFRSQTSTGKTTVFFQFSILSYSERSQESCILPLIAGCLLRRILLVFICSSVASLVSCSLRPDLRPSLFYYTFHHAHLQKIKKALLLAGGYMLFGPPPAGIVGSLLSVLFIFVPILFPLSLSALLLIFRLCYTCTRELFSISH
jgi:hypothetical protein